MSGSYEDDDASDLVGHGTQVAGVIAAQTDNGICAAGLASDAIIYPIRVTVTRSVTLAYLYSGIKKAIELDCDIINMSLGGSITNTSAINEFQSWIKKAQNAGIIVVASAGNYGTTALSYPAAFENVIGVGAVDSNGLLWEKSQRNESVFVTAPGVSVPSLSSSGYYSSMTGTSISAPQVTAIVALIKELCPEYTITDVKNLLKETAVDAGTEGYDTSYGYGIVNIKNIMEKLDARLPDIVISSGNTGSQPRIHVHNNRGTLTSNAFFALHSDGKLTGLKPHINLTLNSGVTNIPYDSGYKSFYLWSTDFAPYYEIYKN